MVTASCKLDKRQVLVSALNAALPSVERAKALVELLQDPIEKLRYLGQAGQIDMDSAELALSLRELCSDLNYAEGAISLLKALSQFGGERGSKRVLAVMAAKGELSDDDISTLSDSIQRSADRFQNIFNPGIVQKVLQLRQSKELEHRYNLFNKSKEDSLLIEYANDLVHDGASYAYVQGRILKDLFNTKDSAERSRLEQRLVLLSDVLEKFCKDVPKEGLEVMFTALDLGMNRDILMNILSDQDLFLSGGISQDGNTGAILPYAAGALRDPLYQSLLLPVVLEATLGRSQQSSFLLSQIGQCIREGVISSQEFYEASFKLLGTKAAVDKFYSELKEDIKTSDVVIIPSFKIKRSARAQLLAYGSLRFVVNMFPSLSEKALGVLYKEVEGILATTSTKKIIEKLSPILGGMEKELTKGSSKHKDTLTTILYLHSIMQRRGDRGGLVLKEIVPVFVDHVKRDLPLWQFNQLFFLLDPLTRVDGAAFEKARVIQSIVGSGELPSSIRTEKLDEFCKTILMPTLVMDSLTGMGNFIGPESYKTLLGVEDVGVVPPVPEKITLKLLNSRCPIANDGRTIGETHVLVFIPSKLDGEDLTMALFANIVIETNDRHGRGWKSNGKTDLIQGKLAMNRCLVDRNMGSLPEGKWILMPDRALPNSGGKNYEEQNQELRKFPDYRRAKTLELFIGRGMNDLENKPKDRSREPYFGGGQYAWCEDMVGSGPEAFVTISYAGLEVNQWDDRYATMYDLSAGVLLDI